MTSSDSVARTLAAGALLVLLGAGLAGCAEDRYVGGCGVVLDGSGSSKPETGFDAEQQVKNLLPKLLADAKCRTVTFSPITGTSRSAYCSAKSIDVDPDATGNVDRDQLRAVRRTAVVKRAGELLSCLRTDVREVPGSDILGGLWTAVQKRPSEEEPYELIVFSDFLISDPEGTPNRVDLYRADLSSPDRRRALIEQLADEGRIPDLSGVKMTTAGYGKLQSTDPKRFPLFDAFWTELLRDKAKYPDSLTEV
ncbi:hypothetical protein J5X84_31600 [Streptosporangiaceae bacterium NEAU-GS5]|nr:hypothetical protein [Streptosporangiaceae bacterium NEAU-GS5]